MKNILMTILVLPVLLYSGDKMEIDHSYSCNHFMIIKGDNPIKKNDRNSHLFLQTKVLFEYGSKKSYLTSKGKRSEFIYTQDIKGGEVYTSTTTSALLVVSKQIIQVVAGDITMSYGCIK